MIIIEGPDGAGKTTLKRELQKRYNLLEGERGTDDRKKLYTVTRKDTYNALAEAVRGHERVRIWDRLYYSELIYADIVGRPCEFNSTEQGFIQRVINSLGCPVILCLPPELICLRNVQEDDQMEGVVENISTIWKWYWQLWINEVFPENVLRYDYTGVQLDFAKLDDIFMDIDDYLEERGARSWA